VASKKADPRIDKRRVTMTSWQVVGTDEAGDPVVQKMEAVDYVRPDILDAYVADARALNPLTGGPKWQNVTVSDEPDAGPAGYDGATHVPAHLDHPLAGRTFPATTQED
jgi:hypothetical protein